MMTVEESPRRPLIGYALTYANRVLRPGELKKNRSLVLQTKHIRAIERTSHLEVVGIHVSFLTNRSKPFYRDEMFLRASDRAKAQSGWIGIADPFELLRIAGSNADIMTFIEDLRRIDVPIFDCLGRKLISSYSDLELFLRIVSSVTRSRRGTSKTPGPRVSRVPGKRRVRSTQAQIRARRLAPILHEMLSSVAPGDVLSGAAVAKELNERGIAAPNGGTWSRQSAANLIVRCHRDGFLKTPEPEDAAAVTNRTQQVGGDAEPASAAA